MFVKNEIKIEWCTVTKEITEERHSKICLGTSICRLRYCVPIADLDEGRRRNCHLRGVSCADGRLRPVRTKADMESVSWLFARQKMRQRRKTVLKSHAALVPNGSAQITGRPSCDCLAMRRLPHEGPRSRKAYRDNGNELRNCVDTLNSVALFSSNTAKPSRSRRNAPSLLRLKRQE